MPSATHRHRRAFVCLHCGRRIDASTNLDERGGPPGKGCVTACLHCAGLMIYTGRDRVRLPDMREESTLLGLPSVRRMLRALVAAHAARHGLN